MKPILQWAKAAWRNPVIGGLIAGFQMSLFGIVAFWALTWLMHWLPWPKG